MEPIDENKRITLRFTADVAATLNEAAALQGLPLQDFLVQAACEQAQRIVDRASHIELTHNAATMLLDLIDAPPKPNTARRRAYERFLQEKYRLEADPQKS